MKNLPNPKVDDFLAEGCGRCSLYGTPECKVHTWPEELRKLRSIALASGLDEEVKWGFPTYTLKGKNIFNIGAFKHFCSLNFFKGSLLKDEAKILDKAGENSNVSRLAKFTSLKEIEAVEEILHAYIDEAIENEKAGKKVESKSVSEYEVPKEFEEILSKRADVKTAFNALTPGRQKGYLLYFSAPKQSKTIISRIEKYIPKILDGKGFHDR
ncbi:YdeI/OmpD-associated family protein [Paracrocinitomix mangrovi]|uniref:YdeI/OmpD-associated family protein n=1 Tax=Paracrocinitomix mangrovi TaxID=2862509 RepID=UPI001C8D2679|nr:DUF1801 domain-containing protein [Paracrocinitomix mangrovi]UKN00348.1 YdeI/OmpD-associated family protein [Paracrocinitomix mangrovi]